MCGSKLVTQLRRCAHSPTSSLNGYSNKKIPVVKLFTGGKKIICSFTRSGTELEELWAALNQDRHFPTNHIFILSSPACCFPRGVVETQHMYKNGFPL